MADDDAYAWRASTPEGARAPAAAAGMAGAASVLGILDDSSAKAVQPAGVAASCWGACESPKLPVNELQPDCMDRSISDMLGTLGMLGMLLWVSGILLSMASIEE